MYNASEGYVEDGGWYGGMYGRYVEVCMLNIQPIRLRISMYVYTAEIAEIDNVCVAKIATMGMYVRCIYEMYGKDSQ